MKATVFSYKMDVSRKLMLQPKPKSAIENDRPKINVASITTVIWGSHLSCRMERKNANVLFAARYWPVKACY